MNDEKFTAVMGMLVEQVVHLITENYELIIKYPAVK